MYERLLNKEVAPTLQEIITYIGKQSNELLETFEKALNDRYDIIRELRFPYGNSYGWGFKYSHKKQHLCDVFFEKNAITITIPIPSKAVEKLNKELKYFLPKTKKVWKERYPCGDGGWVNYRILHNRELMDCIKLIETKKKPVK